MRLYGLCKYQFVASYTVLRTETEEVKGRMNLCSSTVAVVAPKSCTQVVARVLDSKGVEITVSFMSDNLEWAASSICDLYRCRWGIETFFKEIKQTLQIRTFVGFSRNAIEWQIWDSRRISTGETGSVDP